MNNETRFSRRGLFAESSVTNTCSPPNPKLSDVSLLSLAFNCARRPARHTTEITFSFLPSTQPDPEASSPSRHVTGHATSRKGPVYW
ncbi:hypothetical protein CDAR_191871 [Caerostris darwini]|uniref:Uncharacterized protein n=1 Tax=Caerostris darwini TaxID=1538125 RepID=A0AAV4P9I5_9ARAC|nr:hypothetical protein CDAR_191871 [Caerostris darwini]